MTKRKHRSQAEWQAIIQQQKDSGLSAVVFCRQQGLSSKTFYKHRRTQCEARSIDAPFIKIKNHPPKSPPAHSIPLVFCITAIANCIFSLIPMHTGLPS